MGSMCLPQSELSPRSLATEIEAKADNAGVCQSIARPSTGRATLHFFPGQPVGLTGAGLKAYGADEAVLQVEALPSRSSGSKVRPNPRLFQVSQAATQPNARNGQKSGKRRA